MLVYTCETGEKASVHPFLMMIMTRAKRMNAEQMIIFRQRSGGHGGWCSQQLTVLFLILTTFFAVVGGKFGTTPVANDQQSSLVLLNYSGPQPSDKFIPCHFNPGCFCKYDQKTEIYDSLRRLWQLVGFNETSFYRAVTALQREIRNDPTTTYFFPESDLTELAQLVVNSSSSLHSFSYSSHARPLEPGPIFEFVCLAVPMAVIPTEYSAHGVISHVSVTGSELGMLDGSAFAGLEVQNIQLSRDHLYFISEYAFSSMGNSLTVLDLSANFLDEIPFTAFKALKILEWLNLSNNLLHSISGDWFSVSESIRQLSLAGNSIDSLPFKLLPAFSRLVWLDLSSNFIRNLSHTNLSPNLQTLILMKNRFQHFPTGVFHLKSLSWLILGGCSIDRIPTDWPKGVAPLQMNQMDLTENFIQNWPSRPFGAQLTVLDLDVSKNYIQALPAGAFHSMNCFRLSLGYNRIQMIDPEAFNTLESSLQYLNLENNRMPGIPWHAMHNLTSLMHLYVGSNQLTDETVGAPEGMSSILF
ncbi:Leucine-rich repeat-containing G-protein coupled receptor 5 [Orchesella cincta]|uniref:Leucine-rich repeat-containing G-protein coupled receptor 5 n=1 Tax=Orchesella cincta TaxID=48709 RepID=A0A1D2MKC2_ORCCI|nr:Leucine-rich repeat-containing G-protein coupled receptor 5 [Orchesella cincta]